jgi:hypothetical protein
MTYWPSGETLVLACIPGLPTVVRRAVAASTNPSSLVNRCSKSASS